MKRFMFLSIGVLCLAIVVVLFAAISTFAEEVPLPSVILLHLDSEHNPLPCPFCDGNYCNHICTTQKFHCWIWVYPGTSGFLGADFALGIPAREEEPIIDIVILHSTINPAITALGDLWTGVSVMFSTCQMDWVLNRPGFSGDLVT